MEYNEVCVFCGYLRYIRIVAVPLISAWLYWHDGILHANDIVHLRICLSATDIPVTKHNSGMIKKWIIKQMNYLREEF